MQVNPDAWTYSDVVHIIKLALWRIYVKLIPYRRPKETFVITGIHHSGTTVVQHLIHTAYTGRPVKSRLPEWLSFNAVQPIVVKIPFRCGLENASSIRSMVKFLRERRSDPFHVTTKTRSALVLCVRKPSEILSSLARRFPDQCNEESFAAELQNMMTLAGLFQAHRGKKVVVNVDSIGDGKPLLQRLKLDSPLLDERVPINSSDCPSDLDHEARRQWQALKPPSPELISSAFDGIDPKTTIMIKDVITRNKNSLQAYADLLRRGKTLEITEATP